MCRLLKLFIAVLVIVYAAACTSDFVEDKRFNERKSEGIFDNSKRSVADVVLIASRYGKFKTSVTRGQVLTVDENSVTPIVASTTRSACDTLIYAVNYEGDNGYLLISANRTTEPILAIIEEGSFSENEAYRSESFSSFLNKAVDYVQEMREFPTPIPDPILPSEGFEELKMYKYDDTIKSVSMLTPRIDVNWGKWWPENTYCPNKYPGCGPIAIAQAMTYFKPKIDCELTFIEKPFSRLSVDWNKIVTHKQSTDIGYPEKDETNDHISHCNQNFAVHQDIGVLLRQIGVWCRSQYNKNGTSTDVGRFFNVCDSIFPYGNKTYVSGSSCYDKLKSNGIALMVGQCKEGGHAWIMDGVGTIEYQINRYYCYNPRTHEYAEKEVIYKTSKYVHCNWGWAGKDNGYFLEGVYDTYTGLGTKEHEDNRYNFTWDVYGYVYML